MEAILQRVTKDPLGAALAAAVVEGDQVLVLDDAMDFPEDGGRLTLAGQAYTFTAVDTDTETVTLADSVLAAADAGEPVGLLTALGEDASIWTAWVYLDDSPEPVPAHIPSRLVSFYVEGQDQAGSTITLRARDGRYEVETRPGSYAGETNLQIVTEGLAKITGGSGWLLDNGVSAPTVAPRASAAWDDPSTYLQSEAHLHFNPRSLWWNGTGWNFTESLFGGTVYAIGASDGVTLPVAAMPTNFHPFGGAVKVGTNWYVLGLIAEEWYVYIFNASWAKTGQWLVSTTATIGYPALATDGTDLWIVFRIKSSDTLRLRKHSTAGTILATYDTAAGAWTTDVTSLYVGTADWGVTRAVVSNIGDTVRAFSFAGSTLTRDNTRDWKSPNGETVLGVGWNGSNFWTLTESGRLWKFAPVPVTATRTIASTLYDSDAGGTGTHETDASPELTYIQKARWWMRVTVDSPLDTGAADDPDSVRIYINGQLQPALGEGVTTAVYGAPTTGGAAPPTTNGFVGVSSPGFIISGAADADGPIVNITGSGWRLGDLAGDANGQVTGVVAHPDDTDWLNVTPATGWAHVVGNPAQFKVAGGKVYRRGALVRNSGTTTTMGSIPAACRPPVTIQTFVRAGTAWLAFNFQSTTDGGNMGIASAVTTGAQVDIGSAAGTPYFTT